MTSKRYLSLLCVIAFFVITDPTESSAQYRVVMTATDTVEYDIQPDEEEFRILSEFYKQMNGKNWKKKTNWLRGRTSADMANWYGVVVRNGDVSEIHLDNNKLLGKIPKSIYRLDALVSLSLSGNMVSDTPLRENAKGARSDGQTTEVNLNGARESTLPLKTGVNLPMWGLAIKNQDVIQVDWRAIDPNTGVARVSAVPTQGTLYHGNSGVAIDGCGRLAFYLLHSGVEQTNQLYFYNADGSPLTDNGTPHTLNAAAQNIELQVIPVPGRQNEWYIIYSTFQGLCLSNPMSSVYCPAKVRYAHVSYNAGTLAFVGNKREEVPGFGSTNDLNYYRDKTFIQGKAVSKPDGSGKHHLYLAERNSSTLRIHKFTIDGNGIHTGTPGPAFSAAYWIGSIAGSSMELSPDETYLALSNRNISASIKEDFILYNLGTQVATIISVPDLVVYGTNKTVKQLYVSEYPCLRYLKNKLSYIQFSPSGRYLYAVHGGYVNGTGSTPYFTYLIQIDLQSGTGKSDYDLRLQVEKGSVASGCLGTYNNLSGFTSTSVIESAFDGKLYFTKRNTSKLFVVPNPDDPMPHSMVPGSIDLANGSSAKNIDVGFPVTFMPENIDGFDYLTENHDANNNFNVTPVAMGTGETATINLPSFNPSLAYTVSWGDGSTQVLSGNTASHVYESKGDFTIAVSYLNATGCSMERTRIIEVTDCAFRLDPNMKITYNKMLCAYKFSLPKIQDCFATYSWDFGDGSTSRDRSPMHVYSGTGTYYPSVTVSYDCDQCEDDFTFTLAGGITPTQTGPATEEISMVINSDVREEIISTSATTFADAWPLDHNEPALQNLNPFISGSQGVWRNEGAFVYNTDRVSDPNINLRSDGTFSLEQFNWAYAWAYGQNVDDGDLENEPEIPKWTKGNTMTRYNAFGFELENKDVLDNYSAALYDYYGQLQTAYGVNMENEEMGFTGFETTEKVFESGVEQLRIQKPTGNFIFNPNALPTYTSYAVPTANGFVATVKIKIGELDLVSSVDVIASSQTNPYFFIFGASFRSLTNVKILCKAVHPLTPEWSVIVLEKAPFDGEWRGKIRVKQTVVPSDKGLMDATAAHTGKYSLKIDADKTFEQRLIRLKGEKEYHLSAWVSVNSSQSPATPRLADKLGIEVVLKDREGKTMLLTTIVPEGNIIDGWQQLKGSFKCPADGLILSLKFRKGEGTGITTTWYDDLRLHPDNGNMKSFVYDRTDFKLRAILDENNFASIFYYDKEGNLYLTQKETEEGIKTITENINYQVKKVE
jgi:hypothetical protein